MFEDTKKIAFAGGAFGIIVLAVLLSVYILQPKMGVVMQHANQSQIALAVQELTTANIPYRINEEGSAISVEQQSLIKARALIADLGLPFDQSVGLESFADSEFGVTEFAQKINYKRALEGELVRTISSLKEVRYARVHLVLPEKGLLQSKGVDASAAVTLFLREKAQLTYPQIEGIRQLISSSVPQLQSDAVSILDQNGISLDMPSIGDHQAYSHTTDIKRDIEKSLESRVYELLLPEFGLDSAVISVNIELDLDQIKLIKEELLADQEGKGKILSSKLSKNTADKGKTLNENEELTYAYGRVVEETTIKPGSIKKLSAAVSLNAENLSEEKKISLEKLIRHALGMIESRGDSLFLHTFISKNTEVDTLDLPDEFLQRKLEPNVNSLDDLSQAKSLNNATDNHMLEKILGFHIFYQIGGFLFLCLLFGFFFSFLFKKKQPEARQLTGNEREKALADIRQWLES